MSTTELLKEIRDILFFHHYHEDDYMTLDNLCDYIQKLDDKLSSGEELPEQWECSRAI